MNIFAEAARLEKNNQPFAFAQIIESRGSTPRHSGQMLIKPDGTIIGTIGGGMVERRVIEEALQAIEEQTPRLFYGRMARNGSDAVGSDCGGSMTVYIDIHGVSPKLILLGAGHVNRAIAQSAQQLGFKLYVADTYEESLAERYFPPECTRLLASSYTEAISQLPIDANSYVIIATNSQDKEVLNELITVPMKYFGLLASRRKVQSFKLQLRQAGISETDIQRLRAPIGVNIGAETPEEIAISVMAELLQVKNGAPGGLMSDDLQQRNANTVVIRGAGDIATGIAIRLHQSGFRVIMLDVEQPTTIRRTVAFSQAIYDQQVSVEEVTARHVHSIDEAYQQLVTGKIPVLIDPECQLLTEFQPHFLIDAILAKKNLGTEKNMAPVTIALGPGFTAGVDCHAVIETLRGHNLGRVIYRGSAAANTGTPGEIAGQTTLRVIHAAVAGTLQGKVQIGDCVKEGDIIATIDDTPVHATLNGMVRGLLSDGLTVTKGFKIADIDPRGKEACHLTVSDKARALGGAVLEAMLHLSRVNK